MDEGKRPGGLTAMAVLNFIWGGMNILGLLVVLAFVVVLFQTDILNDAQAEMKKAYEDKGVTTAILALSFSLGFLSAILLITSGVGYLLQKKILGRVIGNVYAVIAIASSVISVIMMPDIKGGGFSIMTMIGLIYPVLTLIMLNTVFKEDFIH